MTKLLTLFLAVMASLTTGCATAAHAAGGYVLYVAVICPAAFGTHPGWDRSETKDTLEECDSLAYMVEHAPSADAQCSDPKLCCVLGRNACRKG